MKVKLIRSRRKSLVIEITADLKVVVRAPLKMPEKDINRILGEKSDWITKHLKEMEKRQKERENRAELSEQDIRLLMTKAKRVLPPRIERYAKEIGVNYGKVTIRMQKSRWGSCSSKGNLNFNCLLMNAPEEILDYVIVHELCHRKEMNHSKEFWAEVEKILPDYKERRKWLKDHGDELMGK